MLGAVCDLLKFAVILTLLEFCQNAFLVTQAGVVPDGGSGLSVGYDWSDAGKVEREEKLRELDHQSSGWELSLSDVVQEKGRDEVPAIPPPSSVELEFINISAVLVLWSYPFQDVPPPIQFLLQCSKDGGPYQNVTKLMNSTQSVFGHMLLSAYYQFRVRAYHRGVASEPSQPSYSFLNGITVPPGPPINVKASTVSYNEIALVWDPPFPAPPTPLIYQIAWGTNPRRLYQKESVMGETHRNFQSLSPGQAYFFQMRADISGHISIPSPIVNATTMGAESLPIQVFLVSLSMFTCVELPGVTIMDWNTSAYWVWLSWSAPPSHRYPLTINNFTIYYTEKGGGGGGGGGRAQFCCNLTVDSDQFEANVTNLQPETVYIFSVGYTSRGFRSDLSEEQTLTTTDSLQCYSCEPISSTQLEIKWKTSSRNAHSLIIYETVQAQQRRIGNVHVTGSTGAYTISGLHPWTRHAFVVVLQDSSHPAVSNCPVTDCQTKEDAPSQPPTGLRASYVSSSEATLVWTPPPSLSQNGILTNYVITYQCSPKNSWQQCSSKQIITAVNGNDIITHVVEGLTPFTLYSFQVAAETAAGRGPFSDPFFCTTQQDVPTGAPRNLTAENTTEKSIHLTWDPPLPQDWNGNITGYVIFYTAINKSRSTASCTTNAVDLQDFENGSGLSDIILSDAVTETSMKSTTVLGTAGEINGLRPMTSYSISVAAKTVSGIGAISTALRVQTLKSVIHLTVEVNFSSEIEIISGNNSGVCFNILFTWTPLFGTDGASELLGKNVTACTWSRNVSYSTPASHDAAPRTIHVDTNSTIARIILPIDAYSGLLPGTRYLFWLSVSAQLSNETCANFHSTTTELEIPTCGGDHMSKMAAIIVSCITAASLVIATIIIAIISLRKHWRRCWRSIVSPSSVPVGSYQFEEVHNYALTPDLRRSDGRSDSSSNVETEESRSPSPTYNSQDISSSSSTVEETSPLLDIANDRFHRAYANTSVQSSSTNLEIGYISTESQTFCPLPLDLRQDPDGCSLSSSSSESNLVQSSS